MSKLQALSSEEREERADVSFDGERFLHPGEKLHKTYRRKIAAALNVVPPLLEERDGVRTNLLPPKALTSPHFTFCILHSAFPLSSAERAEGRETPFCPPCDFFLKSMSICVHP